MKVWELRNILADEQDYVLIDNETCEEITEEKLHMIDRAEQFLIELGFYEERVRIHGNIARIEVPAADITRLASDEIRTKVYEEFKKIGFLFVTLDMMGYRMGSMNDTLKKNQ